MSREWPSRRLEWPRRLRALMAEKDIDIKELAIRSGVSRAMIGMVLTGKRQATAPVQAAIAEALGEDPGYVFPRTTLELSRAAIQRRHEYTLGTTPKRPGLEVAHSYVGECEDVAGL